MKKLIIFCPFRKDFVKPTGSNIRIRGYSEQLPNLGICFKFLSPVKPDFISKTNYSAFNLSRKYKKLILLHNIFYFNSVLTIISYVIFKLLIRHPEIKKALLISKDYVILSHQDNSIILFLYLRYKVGCIYDIHGILELQKEYKDDLGLWKKLWFNIETYHEKLVLSNIPAINVVSHEMKEYIRERFDYNGEIYIAPDGLLKLPEINKNQIDQLKTELKILDSDKILMFFGSFKKFGGVHLLADAFIKISVEYKNTKLFLIGEGQMEFYILKKIENHFLNDRFIHIPKVPYEELQNYLQLADLLILPDLQNSYNEITPHIKLFDSIASGKKIIAPDFSVNNKIFAGINVIHQLFKPSDFDDLVKAITLSLNSELFSERVLTDNIESLLYQNCSKEYFENLILS